ncbi:hypothetical protein MASR2M18_16970 [Ignavibacteria bacterium]
MLRRFTENKPRNSRTVKRIVGTEYAVAKKPAELRANSPVLLRYFGSNYIGIENGETMLSKN